MLGAALGRGATSEVFAAEHRFLGDPVALKLLKPDLADDARTTAFVIEAMQIRAIEHPNVVRVLDVGRSDHGSAYLVMERVDGESLAARLARGTLAEAEARPLFAAIADGMQAVHDAGIVHRDLKPGNVMLRGDVPKIVDFGIAKFLGAASAVATARVIGTPAYMAPEQLSGGLIGPFVDIWAFGVMLFEAVTGTLPFAGYDRGRFAQLLEDAPRARTRAPISAALDALIARCLVRDPVRRPASMAELARVLRGDALEPERVTVDLVERGVEVPPTQTTRASRARYVTWAIAGATAVAIGVGAAQWVGHDEDAVAFVPPMPPAIRPAVPAPPPAVPPKFEVHVRSIPAGAQLVLDGRTVGKTPTTLELEGPAALSVRRTGYEPKQIRAERAGTLEVELQPLARPHKRVRAKDRAKDRKREPPADRKREPPTDRETLD
ncbi:MAG TPA: serine/threonine-protein kinase [Kofleriaceae bacterium]|nr:serine/threonine-protein kinase [Kofleriaceae bacterium]